MYRARPVKDLRATETHQLLAKRSGVRSIRRVESRIHAVRRDGVQSARIARRRRTPGLRLRLEHLGDVRRAGRSLIAAAETQGPGDSPIRQRFVGGDTALPLVVRPAITELEIQVLDARHVLDQRHGQLAVVLRHRSRAGRAVRRERAEAQIEERVLRVQEVEDVAIVVFSELAAECEPHFAGRQVEQMTLHVRLEVILRHLRLMLQLNGHGVDAILRYRRMRAEYRHTRRTRGHTARETVARRSRVTLGEETFAEVG